MKEIKRVWVRHGLRDKTKFGAKVESVKKASDGNGWIISNDFSLGAFDGVITEIGICGDPKIPPRHLRQQLHIRKRDRDGGRLPHRRVYVVATNVSR